MSEIDAGFCQAIRHIAGMLMPQGFDVSDHAPATFEACALYKARTGRMCVAPTPATEHVFDNDDTFHAWRAWHDWCHLTGGHPFTLEGECATVRMQEAMIAGEYGEATMLQWKPHMERQIIADNFGENAFCPGMLEAT